MKALPCDTWIPDRKARTRKIRGFPGSPNVRNDTVA